MGKPGAAGNAYMEDWEVTLRFFHGFTDQRYKGTRSPNTANVDGFGDHATYTAADCWKIFGHLNISS